MRQEIKRKGVRMVRRIAVLLTVTILLLAGCGKSAADGQPQESTETKISTESKDELQDLTEAAVPAAVVDTVKTDSFSMDYCKFGSGDDILVILPGISIQSVMGSADAVAQAYQVLAEDYTIYLFDTRQELPASYSVYEAAEDDTAAIQALGLEKVSIFGASYGGMKAMLIAAQHPEMVEKVIVASTSVDLTGEEFQAVENWISLAKKGDTEGLYLAFGKALYPEELFEQSRQLLIDMAKTVTEEELSRFVIRAEGMRSFNMTDQIGQIQCPVLAIGDRQDHVLGGTATENIANYMSQKDNFQLYMYDGYGHAVYDLAPDFKDRMKDFLAH